MACSLQEGVKPPGRGACVRSTGVSMHAWETCHGTLLQADLRLWWSRPSSADSLGWRECTEVVVVVSSTTGSQSTACLVWTRRTHACTSYVRGCAFGQTLEKCCVPLDGGTASNIVSKSPPACYPTAVDLQRAPSMPSVQTRKARGRHCKSARFRGDALETAIAFACEICARERLACQIASLRET